MHAHFLENTVAEVINSQGEYSELKLRRTLKNSKMLSADVNAGYDPLYAEVFEKNNSAYVGKGAANIPEQEERAVLMMPMQNIWVSYVKRLMMQKWNTRQQNWDESMQVAVELSLIFRQLTVWM